jgi:serine protease
VVGEEIVVAVLDTGYRPHIDLNTNIIAGYDMVADPFSAADNQRLAGNPIDNDRDPIALDPGDWTVADECGVGIPAQPSSWHGTHVAGTIAALTNNSIGVAGVSPQAKILPVRVLGKCGGTISDMVAGIRWASGLEVPGITDTGFVGTVNTHPANIINLSIGRSGDCSITAQEAINDAIRAGVLVVAATGNNGATTIDAPANCTGVVAVTAHTVNGDKADYANIGTGPMTTATKGTDISAPGGGFGLFVRGNGNGVLSTSNTGSTFPSVDNYTAYIGTSMAAPHVAGAAALLWSTNPTTLTATQIKQYLTENTRDFPANSYCLIYSHLKYCGSGLLDVDLAYLAVRNNLPFIHVYADNNGLVTPGSKVTLITEVTPMPGSTNTALQYQWRQLDGPQITDLSNTSGTQVTFTTSIQSAIYTLQVSITTTNGTTTNRTIQVISSHPPSLQPIEQQTVATGDSLSLQLIGNDIDNEKLTYYIASRLPENAYLDADTGLFQWNPVDSPGQYPLNFVAYDGYRYSSPLTVTINATAMDNNLEEEPTANGGGCTIGKPHQFDIGLLLLLISAIGTVLLRHRF